MDKIDKLNAYDPMTEAENATGKSIDDRGTMGLSFALHLQKSALLSEAYDAMGDTKWGGSFEFYQSVLTELGFEQVLTDEITPEGAVLSVYARRDGLVVVCDTIVGQDECRLNSATLYYNARPKFKGAFWKIGASGCVSNKFVEDIYCGSNEVAVGLRHTLAKLEEHVVFIPEWMDACNLQLASYADWKMHKFGTPFIYQVSLFREQMLPKWVQIMIAPSVVDWNESIDLMKENFRG